MLNEKLGDGFGLKGVDQNPPGDALVDSGAVTEDKRPCRGFHSGMAGSFILVVWKLFN